MRYKLLILMLVVVTTVAKPPSNYHHEHSVTHTKTRHPTEKLTNDKHEEIHKATEQSTIDKHEEIHKATEQSTSETFNKVDQSKEHLHLDHSKAILSSASLENNVDRLYNDTSASLENNVDRLYNDTEQQEESNYNATMPIAFSAELSDNVVFMTNQTIVMNKILVNEGNLYFNNTGLFVCPNDDVYVFFWTVKRSGVTASERGTGRLMMGNTILKDGPICSYYSASSQYGSGSSMMSLTAQCVRGTSVRVFAGNYSLSIIGTTYERQFTSFSGFRLGSADDTIAASAETSRDLYLADRSRVYFDKVTTNIGGHYSERHSYFRCPVSGMYVFTVTAQSVEITTHWSIVQLVMDDKPVINGSMTYPSSASYPSGSSSATVVLWCARGSEVWVESVAAYTFAYGLFGRAMTSLTAYLLPEYNTIAFSAVLSKRYLGTSGILPFDDILTNVGSHYNKNGSFLCPDDDLYAFIVTLLSEKGSVTAWLQLDSEPLKYGPAVTTISSSSSGSTGNHASATVARCRKGSIVTVKISSSASTSNYFTAGYNYFTGFKIPGQ